MKTLKLFSFLTVLFTFMVIVRCSEDTAKPVTLGTLSGTVTYPNTSGTQTPAVNAMVTLLGTTSQYTVTDDAGMYTFVNVDAGEYDVHASFFVEPVNARLVGLNFETAEDVAVVMAAEDVEQDLTLVSAGQGAEIVPLEANYAWTGSAYANTGAWTYDATHSPIVFEFPYRDGVADFTGAFSQLSKFDVNFDPNDLAGSSIDISIDLTSFDTRSPGGRDPRTTVADNPSFNPNTQFTEYGCIINTVFGLTADVATPSEGAPQTIANDPDRYATFVSTSIAEYGDGYLAKGNVVFHGQTVAVELWFKAVAPFDVANTSPCSAFRTYSGFEGKFLMDAKNDFLIDSSSLGAAILRIQISIVLYKCKV